MCPYTDPVRTTKQTLYADAFLQLTFDSFLREEDRTLSGYLVTMILQASCDPFVNTRTRQPDGECAFWTISVKKGLGKARPLSHEVGSGRVLCYFGFFAGVHDAYERLGFADPNYYPFAWGDRFQKLESGFYEGIAVL